MTTMRLLFVSGCVVAVLSGLARAEKAEKCATAPAVKAEAEAGKPDSEKAPTRAELVAAFREGMAKTEEAHAAVEARKDALIKENERIAALVSEIETLRKELGEKESALSAAFAADAELKKLEEELAKEEAALDKVRGGFRRLGSKRKP